MSFIAVTPSPPLGEGARNALLPSAAPWSGDCLRRGETGVEVGVWEGCFLTSISAAPPFAARGVLGMDHAPFAASASIEARVIPVRAPIFIVASFLALISR